MISEKKFQEETAKLYKRVMDSFDDIDPDIAEPFFHLDNITITFSDGTRFIVNRQPPVRQIWLATKNKGLHFDFDETKQQWICNKTGREFYEIFNISVSERSGLKFT